MRNCTPRPPLQRPMTRVLALAFLAVLAAAAPAGAALLPLTGTIDLTDAPASSALKWTATEKNALAGASVAGVGDFDGDGKADVAVSEPKRDTVAGAQSGAVHVLTAAREGGSIDDGAKAIHLRGAKAGDNAGFDVAGAGDVNGDGLADLLVGAPLAGSAGEATDQSGVAYLVFGRRDRSEVDLGGDFGGVRITGAEEGAWLGRAVASLPDVNGDGRPELIVSAPKRNVGDRKDAGSTYVIFGRASGGTVDVSTLVGDGAGYRIDGPVAGGSGGALAGLAISSIGDLSGDGRSEVLVGAPRAPAGAAGAPAAGLAFVVRGRPTAGVVDLAALGAEDGYVIAGPAPREQGTGPRFAESLSGLGDVNGDTLPDLVVGSHLANGPDRARAGIAYVVFGKADTARQDASRLGDGGYRIIGVSPDDQTGAATASAGDFNADGLDDVVVSAPFADPLSRANAGAVYVAYGKRGEQTDLDLAEVGDRGLRIAGGEGDVSGFAIDGAGDIDGDGGPDLVLGGVAIDADYLANTRTTKAGSAAIVLGAGKGQQPGAEIINDPGYQEELARGCKPVLNVQAVLDDDDYNDRVADPQRIRLDGIQAYVATPRNFGTVLGVTAFGQTEEEAADEEFVEEGGSNPIIEPTVLRPGKVDALKKTLFENFTGDDPFPGYETMFTTLADDNPAAGARIMVIDGYTFRRVAELEGLTDGSAPTYIVAIGDPPDRNRNDIRQMKRVVRETKGRYYEARSARQLERKLQAIVSKIRCDIEADNFREHLDAEEEAEVAETELEEGVHTADIALTWRDEDEDYEIDEIQILDEEGEDVYSEIDEEEIEEAYETSSRDARVVAERGKTFRSLHVRGLRAGRRLRVIARSDDKSSSGRVYARITQSRRRR